MISVRIQDGTQFGNRLVCGHKFLSRGWLCVQYLDQMIKFVVDTIS